MPRIANIDSDDDEDDGVVDVIGGVDNDECNNDNGNSNNNSNNNSDEWNNIDIDKNGTKRYSNNNNDSNDTTPNYDRNTGRQVIPRRKQLRKERAVEDCINSVIMITEIDR